MTANDGLVTKIQDRLSEILKDDQALALQEEGVRRRRKELQSEAEILQSALAVYQRFGLDKEEEKPIIGLFDDFPKDGSIADLAMAVLARNDGKAKVSDIVRALQAIGRIDTTDQFQRTAYGSVYSILLRDPRFVRSGKGEFALRERPAHG